MSAAGQVLAVCRDADHRFSKNVVNEIEIAEGLGVTGDAHAGETVQHLSRVKANPAQPNLRQIHLIHAELFDEMAVHGFRLQPRDLGENITTREIDLLSLGRGALLYCGDDVVLEVTGLRNPCHQIDNFAPGLLKHVAAKTPQGIMRKSGIMTIVRKGGILRATHRIRTQAAAGPHIPLERV